MAEHDVSRRGQKTDDRRADGQYRADERRHKHRDRFGMAQREPLRYQLAQKNEEVRYNQDNDHDRDGSATFRKHWNRLQPCTEPRSDSSPSGSSVEHAEEGNAN